MFAYEKSNQMQFNRIGIFFQTVFSANLLMTAIDVAAQSTPASKNNDSSTDEPPTNDDGPDDEPDEHPEDDDDEPIIDEDPYFTLDGPSSYDDYTYGDPYDGNATVSNETAISVYGQCCIIFVQIITISADTLLYQVYKMCKLYDSLPQNLLSNCPQ